MAAADTMMVTIDEQAKTFLEQEGLCPALERMIDHARDTVADLATVRVEFDDMPETDTHGITISFRRSARADQGPNGLDLDTVDDDFSRWMVTTFAPETCWPFAVLWDRVADAG